MRLTHFFKEGKGIRLINSTIVLAVFFNLYSFGYIAGMDKTHPKVMIFEPKKAICEVEKGEEIEVENNAGNLVASKTGTRVYYIWCSGVNRIKPENRRYFGTLDEALKKGYKPAQNCPGM